MSQRYSIVFSGNVAQGCSEDEVKAKLAERFSMSPERVARIFTGRPVVVRKGLDQVTAETYQRIFSTAGAICAIRPDVEVEPNHDQLKQDSAAPPAERPPQAPPRPMTFPSGFWRRLFAFLIDGFIIAIPGWIIGWVYYDQLVRIGQTGRLIGFAIALGYFAVLNSSIGNGQTLGKRLLKIRVVDLQGGTIPLHRSALRYLLFWLPFFCNKLNVDSGNMWLASLLTLIIFGLGGGIIYLFLSNRKNRRTVHDFAAGTVVVRAEPHAVPEFSPVWRGHYYILTITMVGRGVTGAIFIPSLRQNAPFAEMLMVQQTLQHQADIHAVGVQDGVTKGSGQTTHWFAVNVIVSDPYVDFDETADRFATLVLTQQSLVDERDLLVVNVICGYDIGIASRWQNRRFSYSPNQWRSKLGLGRL
jgi:uncharacterized RDD family membrane protein YckC